MSACIVCHDNPAEPQVCPACTRRVAAAIAELPALLALAGRWLEVDTMRAIPGSGSASRNPPMPCDPDLLDAANPATLLAELGGWEADWREELGAQGDTQQATAVELLGWLGAWWPVAAQRHPAADEFARDLLRAHQRALDAMRLTDVEDGIDLACPADVVTWRDATDPDTGQPCMVQVVRECRHLLHITRHVVWAAQPDPETGEWPDRSSLGRAVCPRCGTDWSADRLIAVWRTSGQAVWLDADVVAGQLGASVRDLARLAREGRVQRRYSQWRIVGAT